MSHGSWTSTAGETSGVFQDGGTKGDPVVSEEEGPGGKARRGCLTRVGHPRTLEDSVRHREDPSLWGR